MSYREENGQVVLTMKAEDYEVILMALGAFTAMTWRNGSDNKRMFELMNRLNQGQPALHPVPGGRSEA